MLLEVWILHIFSFILLFQLDQIDFSTYLQDTNFADLIPNISNLRHYKVKINKVYTNDNIFFGSQGPTNESIFYTIDLQDSTVGNFQRQGQRYLTMYITLDQQINQFSRSVYSFWDMFGYIGGIYGLLISLGYILFNFWMQRTFYSWVLSDLYHVETEIKDNNSPLKQFYGTNLKNIWENINDRQRTHKIWGKMWCIFTSLILQFICIH